jgi:hypothetical protein
MPRRSSVEDYFDQLPPNQRPHLDALRELSLKTGTQAREELKWNLPTELCTALMQARIDEYEATGASWSED